VDNDVISILIRDALWLLIVAGWMFLILTGLEADKPLSGGIPGHLEGPKDHEIPAPNLWEQLGEYGAWIVFGLTSAALPIVLWWIFTTHPS
jgi:hypothetical protein